MRRQKSQVPFLVTKMLIEREMAGNCQLLQVVDKQPLDGRFERHRGQNRLKSSDDQTDTAINIIEL